MMNSKDKIKKVVFIARSVQHFSYFQSIVDGFVQREFDVHIYFDQYWSTREGTSDVSFNEWRQKNQNVSIGWFPKRTDHWRKIIVPLREFCTYSSYCARGPRYEFYTNRWASYLSLPFIVKKFFLGRFPKWLFGFSFFRRSIRAIETFVPPDNLVLNWLNDLDTSLLVITPMNMRFSEEVEVAKAARKLNVPFVVPVLSWDNLATKGLMHVRPTALLAWHDEHAFEAKQFHSIPAESIKVIGSPFFDKWFDGDGGIVPREDFLRQIGVGEGSDYILYLGSSANIAVDESWIVKELQNKLAQTDDDRIRNIKMVFRSHPANWRNKANLSQSGVVVWPLEGTLPDSSATLLDFRNSLHHASAVIGINTSGMLDAVIYGKPVLSPLLDQYRLTQINADHFVRMAENGALYVERDLDSICARLQELLSGQDPLETSRQAFVKRFVRPRGLDRSAGEVVVEECLALIQPVDTNY